VGSKESSPPGGVLSGERVFEELCPRSRGEPGANSLDVRAPGRILLGGSSSDGRDPKRIRLGSGCSWGLPPRGTSVPGGSSLRLHNPRRSPRPRGYPLECHLARSTLRGFTNTLQKPQLSKRDLSTLAGNLVLRISPPPEYTSSRPPVNHLESPPSQTLSSVSTTHMAGP
jgi:hypothetical protein